MKKENAIIILKKYVSNEKLVNHCLDVGKVMSFYAELLGEDKQLWEITGILHDLDWEQYPNEHPNKIKNILDNEGESISEESLDAILGHAYPSRTSNERTTLLAKYLFACDELTGFITAYSLMKGGLSNVEAKSVVKKLKDKAFARGVNRDDVHLGIQEISPVNLEEHITNILKALSVNE